MDGYLAVTNAPSPNLPAVIADAGEQAAMRFIEFFTANIRNPNTRAAYLRAASGFFSWCQSAGLDRLALWPQARGQARQGPGALPRRGPASSGQHRHGKRRGPARPRPHRAAGLQLRPRRCDKTKWLEGLRSISMDELDCLGLDSENRLYWDGAWRGSW